MVVMQSSQTPLIGSILERKPRSAPAPPSLNPNTSAKSGFPAVEHRSKSAFARAREQKKNKDVTRAQQVPVARPAPQDLAASPSAKPESANEGDWRDQMSRGNQKVVEAMSEEEREREKAEILERFGPGIGDLLRKVRAVREVEEIMSVLPSSKQATVQSTTPMTNQAQSPEDRPSRPVSPPSAMSRPGSRPASRADRNVRFADVNPSDIHVYESEPPSPRKAPLALPPPTESDGPTVSLGEYKGNASPVVRRRRPVFLEEEQSPGPRVDKVGYLEEGTPEDIRRRFFPTAPAHDPSLEWIETSPQPDASSTSDLRFDLTGTPIPPHLSSSLPTHLGLHHHAEGSHAGYTLDDIFMLSRSTVPAQRATMLGVLGRIARRLGKMQRGSAADDIISLRGKETELRKRMLASGVEAMAERGSLGARGIEVLWECIVGWDEELASIEGVELRNTSGSGSSSSTDSPGTGDDPLASLPLDYVLPQISSAFATFALPRQTLQQLLAILHRLAQHSNETAATIVTTPGLIRNTLQTFLLTPIPPLEDSPVPDPLALQLLSTLSFASRTNAAALLDPADALLRFVATIPNNSPFPRPLATALLTGTLRLYTILASYGLYAHIATTASEQFAQLRRYVFSEECQSKSLRKAWLGLIEAWMVCARDPHHTTPPHEVLWSQIVGWGWGSDVMEMKQHLTEDDTSLWSGMWLAQAAWLEGAGVNGIKSGEEERNLVVQAVKEGFRNGLEWKAVDRSGNALSTLLGQLCANGAGTSCPSNLTFLQEIAQHTELLVAAMRLWLACLPPRLSGPPDLPPFSLPFAQFSSLCKQIMTHPLWTQVFSAASPSYMLVFCRPLSSLLAVYFRLSRRVPGTSDDVWLAQAFTIPCKLLPGDEEVAQHFVNNIVNNVTVDYMHSHNWGVPPVLWEKGGLKVIEPFLSHSFKSKEGLVVAPIWPSPQSISSATTQRLPPASQLIPTARRDYPLPLARDWLFYPLDLLLRSGDTEVFKSLPPWWDASETEVVRATLLLARISTEVLRKHAPVELNPSREEVVFACMKVFMLEHGQQQNDSTEEVFRDSVVGQFMDQLLAPFNASASPDSLLLPPPPGPTESLEAVAARFLGSSTPFYQFYTDFVGLYDSISFSHPLFARLLLPPLSMQYSVDYRKYLWADYGHILKTIRTPVEAVVTGNVGVYLWPVESDAQVIGAYLRALAKDPLDGFVRMIAVHHIACNVWPDLQASNDIKAGKLLQAVVGQGDLDVVREIICYRQVREDTLLLPPTCFEQTGDWKAARLEFAEQYGGSETRNHIRGLLEDK